MAVTLVDALKQSNDPLQKGFIMDLLRFGGDALAVIPFRDVNGLQVTGQRWQTIMSSGFRKLNAGYSEGTGTIEDIMETLFLLGGDIKIDRVLADAGNYIENPLATQTKMRAKSVAFQFLDSFINGDNAVNPDSFEGLKKRVANMPSRQTIDLADGGGDALKVLASAANEATFIDALHQAMKYSSANYIFMNEDTWLGNGQVLRRAGLLDTTRDAYDREFEGFRGVPLVDIGFKSDKSTEVITNTEDPGDGGNDSTSMYFVNINTEDGLHGIQLSGKGMDVYDPLDGAELESGPQILRRVDWPVGLFNLSEYSIVRLKGFKMAAA